MDLKLSGKVALITGSSRGIGLAIAQALHAEGCTVILNARHQGRLVESARSIGGHYIVGDVCIADEARRVVAEVIQQMGRIDILVANVGSGASVQPGTEDEFEWTRMLNINLQSATQTIAAAKDALITTKGVALCISSICGLSTLGAPIAYSAAKAALNSYIRGIGSLLAKDGVRILGLAPGNVIFEGSTWERKLVADPVAVKRMLELNVPMLRLGLASEIADVATFLCSFRASFITGTVIVADGGQIKL